MNLGKLIFKKYLILCFLCLTFPSFGMQENSLEEDSLDLMPSTQLSHKSDMGSPEIDPDFFDQEPESKPKFRRLKRMADKGHHLEQSPQKSQRPALSPRTHYSNHPIVPLDESEEENPRSVPPVFPEGMQGIVDVG